MKKFIIFILFFCTNLFSQEKLVQSGPMLGYSDFFECLIWIQTTKATDVKVQYWIKGTSNDYFETNVVKTRSEHAFVAKLIANKVQPGNWYQYKILIDGQEQKFDYPLEFQSQKLWEYRTDPPEFKFAMGSGFFVNDSAYDRNGKPYGSNYQIMNEIHKLRPDFMVWLGDNIYLREPDWNTWTGITYRYTHGRSVKELQPLLASTHHYAIWDDHDYGPNDSDRGFFNKKLTLDAFKLFWGNPSYGFYDKPGAVSKVNWGDVDLFLMDDRYYKSPNNRKNTKRCILGDEQIEWLIDNLSYSKATFKIIAIGSEFLSPVEKYENFSTYKEEQSKIIDLITKEKISGVIFITGDRHFSEISKLERPGTYPIYDFVVSALCSGSNKYGIEEKNTLRVKDAVYTENNFGIMEITGKRKDRKLTFKLYNHSGKEIFKKEILENELK